MAAAAADQQCHLAVRNGSTEQRARAFDAANVAVIGQNQPFHHFGCGLAWLIENFLGRLHRLSCLFVVGEL